MAKIQTIRGMNDLSPLEVKSWSHLEKVLKSIVSSYGYQEIRFPIVCLLYTSDAADDP